MPAVSHGEPLSSTQAIGLITRLRLFNVVLIKRRFDAEYDHKPYRDEIKMSLFSNLKCLLWIY
jgi:hypothetical protein